MLKRPAAAILNLSEGWTVETTTRTAGAAKGKMDKKPNLCLQFDQYVSTHYAVTSEPHMARSTKAWPRSRSSWPRSELQSHFALNIRDES